MTTDSMTHTGVDRVLLKPGAQQASSGGLIQPARTRSGAKLVATRPATIIAETGAQRWFPYLFRHPDGTMLLYVQNGYDRNFAPAIRFRSVDGGRRWYRDTNNVPRIVWAHWFDDGELFEIDNYGVMDPKTSDTFCYYAALSCPQRPASPVRREYARVESPSVARFSLTQQTRLPHYPTHFWWDLFNGVMGKTEVTSDEITISSLYLTGGIDCDGLLLGFGSAVLTEDLDLSQGKFIPQSTTSVLCYESGDRGRTWRERGLVARGSRATPEGFNEPSVVQLRDGRLYVVFRSGARLHHAWSSDGARTWTNPEPISLIDEPDHHPRICWPVCVKLADDTLVLVYGRPGKHVIFDPSGTGTQWQGRLDLQKWEQETQVFMGVPPNQTLRGPTEQGVRYWDSGDYLGCVVSGPREVLVCYDVQNFQENWNSPPEVSAVRLVRVRLEP